jgi:hypothetical protein
VRIIADRKSFITGELALSKRIITDRTSYITGELALRENCC